MFQVVRVCHRAVAILMEEMSEGAVILIRA